MKTTLYLRVFNFILLCLLLSVGARAQFGSEIGARSVSTLAWQQFFAWSSDINNGGTIGLTTDGRVYTWGGNSGFTIHAKRSGNALEQVHQTVPYYVPFPAGEVVKKVGLKSNFLASNYFLTYFALSQSGKLYAWGCNSGLLETAWPAMTSYTVGDTTKTVRKPVQLTILGESSFVDFDASAEDKIWIAIGASGNAYHIGQNGPYGSTPTTSFATMAKPTGVDAATFKYTNVWLTHVSNGAAPPQLFLKGNNGKIYFAGTRSQAYASGVPSIVGVEPTAGSPESNGNVLTLAPIEVPFPAGEDIVSIKTSRLNTINTATYAISSSGKAYIAGMWKRFSKATPFSTAANRILLAPLATPPANSNILRGSFLTDSVHVLKQFTQIALPPGATKILDLEFTPKIQSDMNGTLVVADNNKAYWSGNNSYASNLTYLSGNFLSLANQAGYSPDKCLEVIRGLASSEYSWTAEAINYEGAKRLFGAWYGNYSTFAISSSNRGYYVGAIESFSGLGKMGDRFYRTPFPAPIANEQLLDCQTSPGTGGPLTAGPVTPTNTAVGTIDCSKTKLYPAPVAGVPSQLSLIVTVNVTTIGDFTPVTVSGSGMSLPSGFSSVTATTTGVQTFHIPLKYDGTALSNSFQFTVGSAGSCTADLTQKPNQQITNVWSLTNCSAITPGVLSK